MEKQLRMNNRTGFPKTTLILALQLLILMLCTINVLLPRSFHSSWQADQFSQPTLSQDGNNQVSTGPDVTLRPGVYLFSLQYQTTDDMVNAWVTEPVSTAYGAIRANACMLYSGLNSADMFVWVSQTTAVHVKVTTAAGSQVTVLGAGVQATRKAAEMLLVSVAALLAIGDLLWLARKKKWVDTDGKKTAFFLVLLVLASSLPLLNGYEIAGADTIYHMLRIEGIKDGLLSGQFPVRIQPNWLQGYGYATGIFYCDTFLYLPAFLRIAGFPVGTCYLLYKLMVNLATVLIAYFSLRAIFGSRWTALFGSALYTLNIYRLLIFYLKDHLGEYTAMAFLPLLLYAIWRLLTGNPQEHTYRRTFIVLTIAVTALIQCHVLTCEMAGLTTLVILLICFRRTFRKGTLLELLKAAVSVLMLNLWFILPFADYLLHEKLVITGSDVYTRTIQSHGAAWPMLLGLIQFYGGSDNEVSGGMVNGMPFTTGAALLLGIVYLIWLCLTRKKTAAGQVPGPEADAQGQQMYTLARFSAVFGILGLVLASAAFPWDALQKSGSVAQRMISALQYPTRWLEIAALFLTVLACAVLTIGWDRASRRSVLVYLGTTLSVLVVAVSLFLGEMVLTAGFYKIYEEDAMGNSYLSGREYLPEGTDETLLKAGQFRTSDTVSLEQVEKKQLEVTITCQNTGKQEGYAELPLLYYRGYRAVATETGQMLQVVRGDNNVVRVRIPAGFSGQIRTAFVSPVSWRTAEIISAAAWVFAVIFLLYTGYDRKRKQTVLTENGKEAEA